MSAKLDFRSVIPNAFFSLISTLWQEIIHQDPLPPHNTFKNIQTMATIKQWTSPNYSRATEAVLKSVLIPFI